MSENPTTVRASRSNLYAISANLGARLGQLEEGEISPGLADEIDALEASFVHKAHGCICVLRSAEARAAGIQTEIDRLTAARDAEDRKAAWLKKYIREAMERAGLAKVITPLFTVRVQANGRPAIRLREGAPIPESFQRVIPESIAFDGNAAYAAWRNGEPLGPDVEVVEGKHLRIK